MNNEIEIEREKYPISFDEICLYSSFEQILGRKKDDYSTEEKRRRWSKIMSLDKKTKKYWNNDSRCVGCVYLKKAWCEYSDLPCTVGPILSFRYGVSGMACGGIGRVNREPKLFEDDDLPF
jgi:hypothetical protein